MEEVSLIASSAMSSKSHNSRKLQKTKAPKHISEKPPKAAPMIYRSNMVGIVTLMSELKLENAHIEGLKRTPFWFLFDALLKKKLTSNQCRKSDKTVVKIIKAYDSKDHNFRLGGHIVKLTKDDIKLIFGISCGNEPINMAYGSKDDVGMVQRRSLEHKRLTVPAIKELLVTIVQGKEKEDIEDVVRLLCLYLCHTLFFSTGTTVKWAVLEKMEDLEKMRKYDWCGAIRSTLMTSINKNHRRPKTVTGCVMLLLYWLCEHTKIVKSQNPKAFPRFLKWSIPNIQATLRDVALQTLDPYQVDVQELKVTEIESRIYHGGEDDVYGCLQGPFLQMSQSSKEEADISDLDSVLKQYTEESYEELMNGSVEVDVSHGGVYKCPYCPGEDFQYEELFEHASGAGKGLLKNRSTKEKGRHLGLVRYMEEILNMFVSLSESAMDTTGPSKGKAAEEPFTGKFPDLFSELRKMKKSAGSQLEKFFHEHEKIAKQLEAREKYLKEHEKELEEWEAKIQKERMQIYSQKKMYERAILEKKKAEENALWLAEEQKKEKEELHKRIVELQKKLDAKQALELALKVITKFGEDGEVELKNKMEATQQDQKEKEQYVEHLESLNNILTAKERKSNDELQEARKELINGFMDSNAYIGVKKMGELDCKPFQTAAKRKYCGEAAQEKWAAKRKYEEGEAADEKAVELCSLWEDYVRDPRWHPFKVVSSGGDHKGIVDEEDEKLKSLKEDLGNEVYEAVVTALTEMNHYNPSGRCPVPELWNFKEERKATIKEGVSHLLKQLQLYKRRRN